jgi:SSS family solute:Na+ symporter
MHWIDYLIFVVYMFAMLGVESFKKKIKRLRTFVSGRNMSSWHIGLSVVARQLVVFSIILEAPTTMGDYQAAIHRTLGAWLSAVFLFQK